MSDYNDLVERLRGTRRAGRHAPKCTSAAMINRETIMPDWEYKEQWRMPGKGFIVTVNRHNVPDFEPNRKGTNRWCVYSFVYPEHPMFADFSSNGSRAGESLPLHCGVSFFEKHEKDGKITSYQIGCDYDHLNDEHYSFISDYESAGCIFRDAKKLFEALSNAALRVGSEGQA